MSVRLMIPRAARENSTNFLRPRQTPATTIKAPEDRQ